MIFKKSFDSETLNLKNISITLHFRYIRYTQTEQHCLYHIRKRPRSLDSLLTLLPFLPAFAGNANERLRTCLDNHFGL